MEPDRDLQRRILERLQRAHPRPLNRFDFEDATHSAFGVTLAYLADHGLVDGSFRNTSTDIIAVNITITQDGIDHLREDGGLAAELGVVTIRLHEDSVKAIIDAWLREAVPDRTERQRWSDALRALPAETTKHLVLKLVDLGLRYAPDALHTIEMWLRH